MQNAIKNYEDVDSYKTIMFLYQSAIKEVGTKLEILNDEFHHIHKYNPIEHIKTRVKTPESIVKKLHRYRSCKYQKKERCNHKYHNLYNCAKSNLCKYPCNQCSSGKPDGCQSHSCDFNYQCNYKYN